MRRHVALMEYAPNLVRELTPGDAYLEKTDGSLPKANYLLRTDAEGFFETGNSNRGQTPIYILGDSFSEGLYEHEGLRFSDILERNLNQREARYRVLNGSFSGATLLHEVNVVINKVLARELHPETVVILFKPQYDLKITDTDTSYWNQNGAWSHLFPNLPERAEEHREHGDDLTNSERLLEVAASVCQTFGVRLLLGTAPVRNTKWSQDPLLQLLYPDERNWHKTLLRRDAANALVRRFAANRDLALIDADRAFSQQPNLLYDFTHMNHAGQQVLAELLTNDLITLLG